MERDGFAGLAGINERCPLPRQRARGIPPLVENFLHRVDRNQLDGFWIYFDVDVLSNVIMPCVDSPQEDGMSYDELKLVLNPLIHSKKFKGIDITILDPTLDQDGVYAKQFAVEMGNILIQLSDSYDSDFGFQISDLLYRAVSVRALQKCCISSIVPILTLHHLPPKCSRNCT